MGTNSAIYSAKKAVLLAADPGVITGGTCRALLVGTGGTATVVDADGNTCTNIPLQTGFNQIQIQKLTALGTASNVWALW